MIRKSELNKFLYFDLETISQFSSLGELKEYNPELLHKKRLLAISKCDLLDDELETALKKEVKNTVKGIEILFISSHTEKGIMKLKDAIWKSING